MIGRGGGLTAGRMTPRTMMSLEGSGGGIATTTRDVVTAKMHLMVAESPYEKKRCSKQKRHHSRRRHLHVVLTSVLSNNITLAFAMLITSYSINWKRGLAI
jgi:hypothetical protein